MTKYCCELDAEGCHKSLVGSPIGAKGEENVLVRFTVI
jgi:hypothetical protein